MYARTVTLYCDLYCPRILVGLVNQVTSQLLASPVSGLMGMAFQSISTSGAVPFWQAIVNSNGALDSPLMAFHLTRFNNQSQARELEFGGTFTFGAVNNTLFTGDIDFQNIPSGAPGYWIINLAGKDTTPRSFL